MLQSWLRTYHGGVEGVYFGSCTGHAAPEKSTLGVIISSPVYRRGRIRRAKTKSRARVGPEEGSSGYQKATKGGFNRGGPRGRSNNEA